MRFLLSILSILFFCLQSCGQEIKMDKIANLYKEVKFKDQAISYQAQYYIGGCNFELLINGFPVERYYGPGNGSMSATTPINSKILKSGEQNWEVRVYPIHNNGIPQQSISENAQIELKIQGIHFKENGDVKEKLPLVLDFKAPLKVEEKTGQKVLVDSGKPYISYTGTFKADIPYTLIGWSNGEEFNPADSITLKKEVLAKFNELKSMIENKDADKFENMVLHKESEVAQALFLSKEESEDFASYYKEMFNGSLEELTMINIDNVQLHYYCNNKAVTLLFNSRKCGSCKGKSALAMDYKKNGKIKNRTLQIYLYRPKGKKELEVIR